MKIAAYCRVSTSKEEQLDSLENQKAFFTAYASRNGYELVRLYADEGISGTSLKNRDEFNRMMHDAQKNLFSMVVVKDISRLARNTVDFLVSIRQLKALGITVLFLNANMDSLGDSEFVLTIFGAMAQEESANISKRTKFGKRINAEKGRVPQRIFGYDRIDNFTLSINPEEARIVRRIFYLYAEQGLGCRSISLTLNREQAKTKLGSDWNARAVRRVLTNPIYSGVLINHKYEIQDYLTGKQVSLPEDEHFFHERPSWAIVSPAVFQRTQEILESRRIQYDSGEPFRQGRYSGKHLFSTLIKCEHCGRSFCRKTYTYANTRVYWHCATNDHYTAQRCDNTVSLDEPELLEQLRTYLFSQIRDPDAFVAGILSDLEASLPQGDASASDRQMLEQQRTHLIRRRDRFQEMYANDLISLDALKEKVRAIEKQLAGLDIDLARRKQPHRLKCNGQSISDAYTQEIRRFLDLETVTNAELRRIVDHIRVNKNGLVGIVLKKLQNPAK